LNHDYRPYRETAVAVAAEAGRVLLDHYGRVEAREKGPADLVTDADLASQRLIASRLLAAYPTHTLLAEEEGSDCDRSNPWRWVVDPLDGTINFAHGFPFWCVSVALEHAGRLVAGVVHNPLTGQTYSGSLGAGTTLNGRPVRVSRAARLGSALTPASLPTDFGADAARQSALLGRFSTGTHSVRRTGSSALNLALLAAGAVEVCYATQMYPWDAAAGVLLVREAGGTVTRLGGESYDLYGGEILATNGALQEAALAAVREAWPLIDRTPGL